MLRDNLYTTPESHVVKRFLESGFLREWICLREFPVGIKALWNLYRDENVIANLLKRIDLLYVKRIGVTNDAIIQLVSLSQGRESFPLNLKQWKNWFQLLNGRRVWLIEAKSPTGNLFAALGQIFAYTELFQEDYPNTQIEGRGIISDQDDKLVERACLKFGITLFKP